ncbi:HEAT repeat-containing protein 5B-like [Dorcoceras hygrometricum]|uniref:HEAT repeat-containing protein 5B-like n=1 Tax=Dorcoceras hygrometricum TaxID=472368 RepID=A0A2Z7AN52_9LAMI|nr:HEAT repeat-containing protein 5B-like [Dorcoceras hygrometricum]
MASSFYSNTQHIDFESVLSMDDPGMVSMFQAIMASGLEGFLGCPAVIYEAALVDFFENASVQDGVLISTVAGQLVKISKEWFAELVKKKRTMKKKSGSSKVNLEIVAVAQEDVPIQMVEPTTAAPAAEDIFTQPAAEDEIPTDPAADEVTGVPVDEVAADEGDNEGTADDDAVRVNEQTSEPAVDDIVNEEPSNADEIDDIIEQVLADTAQIIVDEEDQVVRTSGEGNQPAGTAEERHWFDIPYDDLIARWDAERPVVTASDTDEDVETMDVGATSGDQQVQFSEEEPEDMEMNDELIDADGKMSLDEILLTIPAELPLPSAAWEVTKITIGKEIKIPGVDENTWYLSSLPQIPVDAKGKEPLQLKDPIKGKPPQEHYYLICADIDLLVQLREKIIDEVAEFFYSFSLKRLANLQIDDSYFAKEELVLSWAEAESTGVALQRKMYILLKYRAVLVRNYLYGWILNYVPGEGDSAVHLKFIDMLSDLLSSILEELKQQAVSHRIRWTRPCCSILFEGRLTSHRDIPAYTIFEVSSQRQYDDTLPLVSEFFKLLKKRALAVVELESIFDYRQPTVFALRFYQFSTVYIQYSLFSRLTTADISSFVASISSEGTVLRNVQIAQNTISVAPIVQLIDEHSSSDSTSDSISMDFAAHDTATTASISLPAAPSPDITEALNQLRASIDQLRERYDGGAKHKYTLLLHLHDFEKQVIARLDAQDRVLGALHRDSNDQRHILSLELQSSHKHLGTQIELNAKINSLDEQVAATRNDLLDFSAQAQQTLNIITSQLSELVAYINHGGNGKKGKVVSSSHPQPPPDDQIRGSDNPGGGGDIP